jgi:hypothetical protein
MQTFLPYRDFEQSANVLDYRRLGKQRVEASQILNIIAGQTKSKAWKNHPAVLMWKGFPEALAEYGSKICREWILRGYVDNMLQVFENFLLLSPKKKIEYPFWLGLSEFHSSHRAALLAKDFEWYSQFNWTEKPEVNYIWPVKK